jgi:hypothetical protein
LDSYTAWGKSIQEEKKREKEQKEETGENGEEGKEDKEKTPVESDDTLFVMQIQLKRPEIVMLEDLNNEESNALFIDSEIVIDYKSSKEIGMILEVNVSALSASSFCLNEKFEPNLLVDPWGMYIFYQELNLDTTIKIESEKLTTVLSCRDFVLLNRIQASWTQAMFDTEEDNKKDNEKEVKKASDPIDNKDDHIENKESQIQQKESVMNVVANTGPINITLVDDLNKPPIPISSIVIDPGSSKIKMNSKITFVLINLHF